MRKTILKASLIVIGSLLVAMPVLAGNWVVITVDELPDQPRAGEPVFIDFVVRQHGKELVDFVSPALTAVNPKTGETLRFEARKGEETGHFTVEATFPSEGVWEWSISASPFQQTATMSLTVLPAVEASAAANDPGLTAAALQAIADSPARILVRWLGAALLAMAVALAVVDVRQRRGREALAMGASASD